MKEIRIIVICLVICICTGITTFFAVRKDQQKIAVIDAVKLFDGYGMKKELEEIDKKKLEAKGKEIDSMGNQLKMCQAAPGKEQECKPLAEKYLLLKNQLENEYQKSNQAINVQVWKRLNTMINEFGAKKGLHVIIGANGMGSVLYSDNYYDVTNEAIEYVNKKYAEGN